MTPQQRIKRQIILNFLDCADDPKPEVPDEIDAENVDDIYDALDSEHGLGDEEEEFRTMGEETGIPCDNFSRHYECEPVATKLDDGTWVGWTHWHGGGKHGEPAAIDWMSDAYELNVVEEQKVMTVRTFSKRDQ